MIDDVLDINLTVSYQGVDQTSSAASESHGRNSRQREHEQEPFFSGTHDCHTEPVSKRPRLESQALGMQKPKPTLGTRD